MTTLRPIDHHDQEHARLLAMSLAEVKEQVTDAIFTSLPLLDVVAKAGHLPENIRERVVRLVMFYIDTHWREAPHPLPASDQQRLRDLAPEEFVATARHWPMPACPWREDALPPHSETLQDVQREVSNTLFRCGSTFLLEQLTYKRRLRGYGGNVDQKIAKLVEVLIASEWRGPVAAWITRWLKIWS